MVTCSVSQKIWAEGDRSDEVSQVLRDHAMLLGRRLQAHRRCRLRMKSER